MSSSTTSTRSMRVNSAHPRYPSQRPEQLSIDDVYSLAEKTRTRTSQESRQQMLVEMQKMVRNDSATSRPLSDLSRAISQGQWRETNSPAISEAQNEDREESSPPGFVRNVEISIKPHKTSSARRHSAEARVTAEPSHSAPSKGRSSEDPQPAALQRLTSAESGRSHRLSSAERRRATSGYGTHVHTAATPTTGRSGTGSDLAKACSPRPGTLESAEETLRMSVVRQCCEVMGPGVCRECRKLRVRMKERERMEMDFPRLRVSEKNVITSAMVRRMFPELTQAEIQDKIARGEVARTGLIFPHGINGSNNGFSDEEDDDDGEDERDRDSYRLRHIHTDDEDSDSERGSGGPSENGHVDKPGASRGLPSMVMLTKLKLKLKGEASTPLFFMDLRHMNSKIYTGRLNKSLKPPKQKEVRDEDSLSVPGNHLPAFVSPRKSKLMEEPAYKVYFDPPLLAKHQQKSTPSFFAGSDNPYSLPDRLPEVIEFADGKTSITDPSMLRSESSMSFVSEGRCQGTRDCQY
nr:hypothetical protein BaRGS_025543 [Batillaria attramentaria]